MLLAKLLGFRGSEVKRRSDALLEAFDLTEAAGQQAKNYSGGMRRRLDIAASLVVVPDLLFLDEPTTGLDPRSRNQVWDIVRALVNDGTTVLLTTQYLEEADELADRIAVIDHGKVIAEGTSGELKASVGSGTLHVTLKDAAGRESAMALLAARLDAPVAPAPADETSLSVPVADSVRAMDALDALRQAGLIPLAFSLGQPSLDEVFFFLTGHPAEPHNKDGPESAQDAKGPEGAQKGHLP